MRKKGLALLKRHAGVNDGDFSMNDVAKEVASECKGLPLAIVAVGSALKGKGINEWKAVSRKLKNSKLFDVEDVDADVYACLKLSYNYLKSENTKFVFLLCSLFAEDFKIDKEDLLRYGIGIGLFDDADTIEDARNELHLLVTNLKDCCLLLDAGEQFVKMHNIVRDVALWIGSEGKNVLMGKAGNGLTEWPKKYGLDRHTAISLMDNNIKVLPTGLECPKLEILLLGGYNHCNVVVPDQFFTQMKALKILTIIKGELSLESLELLENIRTLQLIKCTLRDMSSLRKLKRLGILNLRFSYFVCEISEGLGDLDELRLLDLRETRHPLSVMRRFPPLEEFYGDIKFKDVQIEPTSSEINSEPCFDFSKLRRYKINLNVDFPRYLPGTTALEMKDIEATTLVLFKALYRSLQYFALTNAMGCQNIVPSIDQEGFNELNDLVLRNCKELECIVDTSQQQVPPIAFSNLTKLCLIDLNRLTEICYGANYPRKFLENLEILYNLQFLSVEDCDHLGDAIPTMFKHGFKNLEKLRIVNQFGVQEVFRIVFQLDATVAHREGGKIYIQSLKELTLHRLSELEVLCKGPHILSLQNLTCLILRKCSRLSHIFSSALAENLMQLEKLKIDHCVELEQIIVDEGDAVDNQIISSSIDDRLQHVYFPKLQVLKVERCSKLKRLFHVDIARGGLQELREVQISYNKQLEEVFGQKDEAAIWDNNEIVLGKLGLLVLIGSPSLTNFCPVGYHFIFPSMTGLTIFGCPMISTRFSARQTDTVHAEAKEPQIGVEDVSGVFPIFIHCLCFADIQEAL